MTDIQVRCTTTSNSTILILVYYAMNESSLFTKVSLQLVHYKGNICFQTFQF